MTIDWWALVLVAVVSTALSVLFVTLLAAGIRLVVTARGRTAGATLTLSTGYALLGLAGLLVLFGLYLIIPPFH
ncbi:hypothetical protein SAMN04488543_0083 [Friedmanniella luteola]|uniref:Uncharacterized protein n=1 Tax=Friedmanniella luteola TaxID=546871 RepID=A0A1H1L4U2_9ACTN|nr:hypothetical protein [Friedmanniella luteola]SDR69578.1 hypothetical protein SAMN04488543_0083 [Friedmanniella luteola]